MTLDEFIQSEIDCGRIQDPDFFYIGLCKFKFDDGEELSVDNYENYLDYELKTATIQIDFDPRRMVVWYEIELRAEDKE